MADIAATATLVDTRGSASAPTRARTGVRDAFRTLMLQSLSGRRRTRSTDRGAAIASG
ncbi:Uncharacterised protein [Mycobacteroides abscessus subsp. abscessus]|nr:Uncharacterised protein [Mycobacteroides abscessus subsp. abscessus]